MKRPVTTRQFEKDLKRCQKRGYDMGKFKTVFEALLESRPLPPNARPHALSCDYLPYGDCHVGPDWILIYKEEQDHVVFHRMGTHSDLYR